VNVESDTESQVDSLDADRTSEPQDAGKQSVAEVLIAARKAMQMSQQDLAAELFLDVNVVRVIEQGRYAEIVKQVYLRGYLRSIAKAVNLDGQQIVDLYDEESESYRSDVVIERATDGAVENRFTGPVFKTGMLASAIFCVLLLVTWIFIGDADEERPRQAMDSLPEQVEVTTETAAEADPESIALNQGSGDKAIQPVQDALELSEVVKYAEDSRAIVGAAAAANEGVLLTEVSEPELKPALEPLQSDSRLSKYITTEVTQLEIGVLLEIEAGGNAEIEIIFSGECWLEIVDAEGERIYSDLNGPGDIIRIRGLAPFELLFGNATVARLYYQGGLVDLSRRTTKEFTARIKLPARGTNS
jgi:cytoskeleton protein RodZ